MEIEEPSTILRIVTLITVKIGKWTIIFRFSYASESSEATIEANIHESSSEEEFVTLDALLDNDVESIPDLVTNIKNTRSGNFTPKQ